VKVVLTSILIICFIIAFTCKNQTIFVPKQKGEFYGDVFSLNGINIKYKIIYPQNFDSKNKYPFILFLHGAGERGNDNERQLLHGGEKLQELANKFNNIVLAPQCPDSDYWSSVNRSEIEGKLSFVFGGEKPTVAMTSLMGLVAHYLDQPYIDLNKTAVTGLSMGGMGTFELLWRLPGKFVRAAPICGGGDSKMAEFMKSTKEIRIYHGNKDEIVSVVHSQKMHDALKSIGANVSLTIYQNVGHNCWENVFVDEDYWKWILFNDL
jgi:predicted peptidase